MADEGKIAPGVGLDIGTMNIVSARKTSKGTPIFHRIRDAFLDVEAGAEKSLKLSKASYGKLDEDTLVIIGDSALSMANLFKREARRPLSRGVISAGELDAQRILAMLLSQVLSEKGKIAEGNGEHCYYSVPAAPIDDPEQDVVYHTEIFRKILSELGYTPHPMNESMGIIYSQCEEESFSGLAVSFGAGMCNIALAYQTVKGLDFSVARGGDWIDLHAAKATGKTASQMCSIKEKGVDLVKPANREQEAVVLYIRSLIRYCLENIAVQFRKVQNTVSLPEPIPFVVSGGTSLAHGFLDVFKDEFAQISKKGFPIEISDIRMAHDPMTAVAAGMLVLASEET